MVEILLPNGQPYHSSPRNDPALDFLEGISQLLESRIGELERELYGSNAQWEQITGGGTDQFTQKAIADIADHARVMYLKNPLIQRGIKVKTYYTFGQGVQISATDEDINGVVQAFLDDERNQAELTRHNAQQQKDIELQTDGNLFFVLFTDQRSGRVRVRSVTLSEITDIVCNPEDSKEPWLYLRTWASVSGYEGGMQQCYYPDWRYTPRNKAATWQDNIPIMWDAPVYHLKTGGFSNWLYGLSTVYSQIDWARAYKVFLESIHSYTQAISRIAVKVTTGGGGGGAVAKAKAALKSTIGSDDRAERNPAPATGSAFIRATDAANYEALGVRGLNVDPEDGRRFLLMVAAGAGLPEVFYGDANVGNHATAKSLDRPTELMMRDRQQLWRGVWQDILGYVIKMAVVAPQGPLRGLATVDTAPDSSDPYQSVVVIDWRNNPETGEPYDPTLHIDFPEIINIDVRERIEAIALAHQSQTMNPRTIARLFLLALGVENIDTELAEMYPDDWSPGDFGDGVPQGVAEVLRQIIEESKRG